jgi:hypothetical protein
VLFGCAIVMAIAILYLASIGPAHRFTNFQLNGHLNRSQFSSPGQRICEIVYWPICQACESSQPVANCVSWYLGLWH